MSHLVAAGLGADGDIAGMLSVLAFTFTMVTGGNDTTTGMLGGTVNCSTSDPTNAGCWSKNPELISDAVDEFLRLTSPVQGLARTTTRDVTDRRHHDPRRPEGPVALRVGQPRRARIRRRRRGTRRARPAQHPDVQPRRSLCLGAAAARMQSRVALTELLARFPDFEVDEAGIVWAGGGYVRDRCRCRSG